MMGVCTGRTTTGITATRLVTLAESDRLRVLTDKEDLVKKKKTTTKAHFIEFDETLWRALKARAAQEGTSVSAILRSFAVRYVDRRRGERSHDR